MFRGTLSIGRNVDRLQSDEFWRPFIQRYTSVIQDCPLEAVGNKIQRVSHVSAVAAERHGVVLYFTCRQGRFAVRNL